jgi:diacylglycerol O-acyltransferase / wax synthase
MAQAHGDRLSAVDASFLAQERANSHMHVGAVLIFEGPAPAYEDFLNQIRSRLHLVPRYRHKLAFPPLETGRPIWIDDPSFNLEYHVRHTALPAPGTEAQLRALAARIHSQRLDRAKPLWELWLVQGLEDNRFALISKTHHALVDGISGVDLMTVLFDLQPVPPPLPHEGEPWRAARGPNGVELAARGIKGLLRLPLELASEALNAATHPGSSLDQVKEALEGIGEVAWAGLNPAPETPLNVPIGPHRRLSFVRNDLADLKLVKDTLGGTVNDVVLTVVAGALRAHLFRRGRDPERLELKAMVPISVRADVERGALGNKVAAMYAPLPVGVADPVERFRFVHAAMAGLKESGQAVGAQAITALAGVAAPTVLDQAGRLQARQRFFNLTVTNVPGPQFPLFILGRRLEAFYPQVPLVANTALGIAVMSYDGHVCFGLLGDYDAMADLDAFAADLSAAIDELAPVVSPHEVAAPAN